MFDLSKFMDGSDKESIKSDNSIKLNSLDKNIHNSDRKDSATPPPKPPRIYDTVEGHTSLEENIYDLPCEQIEEVEFRDNQGEPVTSKDVQIKTDDEDLQSTKAVDVSVKTATEAYVTEEIPDLEIDMPEEVINVDGDNVTDELTTTFPEEDILNPK